MPSLLIFFYCFQNFILMTIAPTQKHVEKVMNIHFCKNSGLFIIPFKQLPILSEHGVNNVLVIGEEDAGSKNFQVGI